jgi:hypothetical protein
MAWMMAISMFDGPFFTMRILVRREFAQLVAEQISAPYLIKYIVDHSRWFATVSMGEALLHDWVGLKPSDFIILSNFMQITEDTVGAHILAKRNNATLPALIDFDRYCNENSIRPDTAWFSLLITRAVYSRVWLVRPVRSSKELFFRGTNLKFLSATKRQALQSKMSQYIEVIIADPTIDARLNQRNLIMGEWFGDSTPAGSRSGSGQNSARPPSSRPASPAVKLTVTDFSDSLLEESAAAVRARQQRSEPKSTDE